MVRTFCSHCYVSLMEASPNTVDCRLGKLCGCGARYCGVKCLVAAAQAHKEDCECIQLAMHFFATSRFRATEKTSRAALELGGDLQCDLICADMVVAASDAVRALGHAAKSLCDAEAFELAQKLAQRALFLSAKGSMDEASALGLLGVVANAMSKYDAAVAHYEAALKIMKRLLGDDHVEVAGVCVNLSAVFQDLGRLDEALAMCSSALKIFSKAPGERSSVALCHKTLGNLFGRQGKHDEATKNFSIGFAITLETEGETARAADFLCNVGNVLMNQNKLDEAMEKYVSALRIFEKAKVAIAVAGCHFSIGNLLKEQGKFDVALEHARKALAIFRSKLSHEHADCANCHALIGDIFLNSGKFAEAVDEYDNVQRIRKDVYGEMTPQIAHLYQGKAECFFKLRNWREAVTFFEAAIHIRTVLGADNASLVKLKARLAAAEEQLKAERSSAAASEPTKR